PSATHFPYTTLFRSFDIELQTEARSIRVANQIRAEREVLSEVGRYSQGSRCGCAFHRFNFRGSSIAIFEGHAGPESVFLMTVAEIGRHTSELQSREK